MFAHSLSHPRSFHLYLSLLVFSPQCFSSLILPPFLLSSFVFTSPCLCCFLILQQYWYPRKTSAFVCLWKCCQCSSCKWVAVSLCKKRPSSLHHFSPCFPPSLCLCRVMIMMRGCRWWSCWLRCLEPRTLSWLDKTNPSGSVTWEGGFRSCGYGILQLFEKSEKVFLKCFQMCTDPCFLLLV